MPACDRFATLFGRFSFDHIFDTTIALKSSTDLTNPVLVLARKDQGHQRVNTSVGHVAAKEPSFK